MSLITRLAPWLRSQDVADPHELLPDPRENSKAVLQQIRASAAEGRYLHALALLRAAQGQWPDNPALIAARGSVLFELGRHREAREELVAIAGSSADSPTLSIQRGWAALWSGDVSDAESCMRRAIETGASNWQAHFGMGSVLRTKGLFDDAIAEYRKAQALSPGSAECLVEIAGCYAESRRLPEALAATEELCAAYPDDVAALSHHATVLIKLDRFADANAVYARIAGIQAKCANQPLMPVDAGLSLREGGRVPEAFALYERHLLTQPQPKEHVQYAFTLLKAGRLREGFAHYEFRWMIEPLIALRPTFQRPVWRGQPLEGKTLVVIGEQGFGDVFQFLRYLPHVKQLGARVVLLLQRSMAEVIDQGIGVDEIVVAGQSFLPPFDYCVHLLSLAHVLGTDIDSIPSDVPYIRARDDLVAEWRAKLGDGADLKVGLVWAGDPLGGRGRQKSMTLSTLEPLSTISGVRFFALQKGDAGAEATRPPPGFPVTDLGPGIRDFADTAAIIESLDLVISVCTSVAHLSGAMGKPTWTMLPEPADWRWLDRRIDTPWYPTMTLYRQPTQGDWDSVVTRVGNALQDLAHARAAGTVIPSLLIPAGLAPRVPSAPHKYPRVEGLCAVIEARFGIFQHHRDGTASERALAYYGEDLEAQLALLRAQIPPGATLLEAGCGVGAHAVPLAVHLGNAGHLFVCEPRPALAAVLRNNLAANGVRGFTFLPTDLLGSTAKGDAAAASEERRAPIDHLGLRRLDWIKIGEGMDVEAILRGAQDTLWALRPRVFAAAADDAELRRIAGRLRDFGYHCWRVETPRFSAGNFNRREDDIFCGEVVLAVLALPEESTADVPPVGLAELH